jgi:outer membrane biosynthesis protein TonB
LATPAAPTGPPAGSFAATGSAERTIRYEAAVPIRKVRPSVPDDLHSTLPESTSIVLRVEIDAAGKVVGAAPEGSLTATQKLLAPQAVQAARLWRFQPARKNGEPVESESILRFDFERDR